MEGEKELKILHAKAGRTTCGWTAVRFPFSARICDARPGCLRMGRRAGRYRGTLEMLGNWSVLDQTMHLFEVIATTPEEVAEKLTAEATRLLSDMLRLVDGKPPLTEGAK